MTAGPGVALTLAAILGGQVPAPPAVPSPAARPPAPRAPASRPKASAAPASFDTVAASAAAAREAGRLDDAIARYRQGIALRADWDEGRWYLGSSLYERERFVEAPGLARRCRRRRDGRERRGRPRRRGPDRRGRRRRLGEERGKRQRQAEAGHHGWRPALAGPGGADTGDGRTASGSRRSTDWPVVWSVTFSTRS